MRRAGRIRRDGVAAGIWAAVKADTLLLGAWQIGMYGFMAIAQFWLFRRLLGTCIEVKAGRFDSIPY